MDGYDELFCTELVIVESEPGATGYREGCEPLIYVCYLSPGRKKIPKR